MVPYCTSTYRTELLCKLGKTKYGTISKLPCRSRAEVNYSMAGAEVVLRTVLISHWKCTEVNEFQYGTSTSTDTSTGTSTGTGTYSTW